MIHRYQFAGNLLARFQDMIRRDVEIPPGGAGIDLEQKVRYTGHLEDDGKLVSFNLQHNDDPDLTILIIGTIMI